MYKISASVVAIVVAAALVFVGGVYDYSALITPGTLLTDLALMIAAAVTIAVGAKFAFVGGAWVLKALGFLKKA